MRLAARQIITRELATRAACSQSLELIRSRLERLAASCHGTWIRVLATRQIPDAINGNVQHSTWPSANLDGDAGLSMFCESNSSSVFGQLRVNTGVVEHDLTKLWSTLGQVIWALTRSWPIRGQLPVNSLAIINLSNSLINWIIWLAFCYRDLGDEKRSRHR